MSTSKAEEVEKNIQQSGPAGKFKAFMKALGPGLVAGASGDDPSGIGTYSQTGAQFGYAQLWTALFTFPLQAAIQEICARIALQTGRGLAANIRKHYSKPISVFLRFPARHCQYDRSWCRPRRHGRRRPDALRPARLALAGRHDHSYGCA